jgi:glutamyl-tRNA reductase
MPFPVAVVGVSFKNADLAKREEVLLRASPVNVPHVLLATCNRVEWYVLEEDLDGVQIEGSYTYLGLDCLRHLTQVAAGLDSAIALETEIQGQVKRAYAAACLLPSPLHFLFQRSLQLSKQLRALFPSRKGAQCLGQAILELGEQTFGPSYQQEPLLLVGHSSLNRSLLPTLQRELPKLFLVTATPGPHPLPTVPFSSWKEFRWIVVATHSLEGPIRSALLIDLSVPRVALEATHNIEDLTLHLRAGAALSFEQQERVRQFLDERLTARGSFSTFHNVAF